MGVIRIYRPKNQDRYAGLVARKALLQNQNNGYHNSGQYQSNNFLFYQSKEELVQCICEDYLTQYGQELKESLETGNLDLTLVVRYFDNLPKQKDLLKVIFRWICPNTILTGKCKPRLKRLFWIFFRTSTLVCHSIGFITLRPYLRQTP